MDKMNHVIAQYDFTPTGIRKGRGCVLIDTKEGTYEIAEFIGPTKRAEVQAQLLEKLYQKTPVKTERILPNKEGQLLSFDREKRKYLCQTHLEGRECSWNDLGDCKKAITALVQLEQEMYLPMIQERRVFHLEEEILRHNRDLIRIRKYLRGRSRLSVFEYKLLQLYDHFAQQARDVMERLPSYGIYGFEEKMSREGTICHGDYQFHNCLLGEGAFGGSGQAVIHFEKWYYDVHIRDFYHFFRKVMEKKNWDERVGRTLIDTYLSMGDVKDEELIIFVFRLMYPEKFWKIMNYYMYHGKVFIYDKNLEKCEKLIEQENARNAFLQRLSVDILSRK